MADPLHDLLTPYFDANDIPADARPSPTDPVTSSYLTHLTTLSLAALTTNEPQALSQQSASILRQLQALSKRSHKSLIASSTSLSHLRTTLPELAISASELRSHLPSLDSAATAFATKYSKSSNESDAPKPLLQRRRAALLLSRNADRISDILDLPTLLSSAISSSSTAMPTTPGATMIATSGAATANYASALDLYAHIKRLHTLYPDLQLTKSLAAQAEAEMRVLTSNLINALQAQGLKLAVGMRVVGWLRRVAPELEGEDFGQKIGPTGWKKGISAGKGESEGALGALFLVCRLGCLVGMLEALEPLRELAEQEKGRDGKAGGGRDWATGQQTERYLKRYIEIFREQSFALVSMYRSIFPQALVPPGVKEGDESPTLKAATTTGKMGDRGREENMLLPLPSALATFPAHLVDLLFDTLRKYLPNVKDRASRDSLLTQVLYCAGSLGRLGGDFGMMLALLEEELEENQKERDPLEGDREDTEWVEVMKKHRVQASRLELLASGVGAGGRRDSAGSRGGSPVGIGRTSSPAERVTSPLAS